MKTWLWPDFKIWLKHWICSNLRQTDACSTGTELRFKKHMYFRVSKKTLIEMMPSRCFSSFVKKWALTCFATSYDQILSFPLALYWIAPYSSNFLAFSFAHCTLNDTIHEQNMVLSCYRMERSVYNSLTKRSLRGVVVDLSGLRDRGPGFKTRSRPLTFMKADTNFRTLHVVGFSCTNEFYRIPSCKRR